jgi:hypothetical protein
VNERLNLKTKQNILPFLGLAFLLLISPCKVRNFIQSNLDVPQTEVTNKSKTSLSHTNCSDADNLATSTAGVKKITKQLPAVFNDYSFAIYQTEFSNSYLLPHHARNNFASAIPLYILYQHIKDYL